MGNRSETTYGMDLKSELNPAVTVVSMLAHALCVCFILTMQAVI